MKSTIFFVFLSLINFTLCFGKSYSQMDTIEVSLSGKKITDIKNDGVDIWVATEGDGIYKYVKWKDKWYNFSSNNHKIKQDFFYSIEVGKRYIWAGSANGLYIYDKKRKRWSNKRFLAGGQFGNWIRSLKYDQKENKLWIGRFKFLTEFDLKTKKYTDYNLTVDKNAKTNSIKSIELDGDSLIWVGVESGVHKYNKSDSLFETSYYNSKTNYFLGEGDQVSVSSILFEQNNIWFGTDEFVTAENPEFNTGGLFRFDRMVDWIKFDEYSKLNGSGIFSLELTGNYIWVSVYKFNSESKTSIGKGINLINRKNLRISKVENNLIPEAIYCMHFDGNSIWLGTNDGIRKIKLTNNFLPDFG